MMGEGEGVLANDLIGYVQERRSDVLSSLEELVGYESPSSAKPELDVLASCLVRRFAQLGAEVSRLPVVNGGDHVLARIPCIGDDPLRPALVLCHFDTVWPVGTLARRPFRVQDGVAWGPGVLDMKSGIVALEAALGAICALGGRLRRPITALLTSDEEIGSPTSRAWIEEQARACEHALVLEPSLPDGALKLQRKGVGAFRVEVTGRAAHAGVEPERGVSAIQELALQIPRWHGLTDLAVGTTVNVGVVSGGTRSNVVAASARADIDVRAWTAAEAERITSAIEGSRPLLPGAALAIRGGFNRPPMELTEAGLHLFERARSVARGLGYDLTYAGTGGGSDGNLVAALGVPVLDGLGPAGGGAHAEDEHVVIDSLLARIAFLASLLMEL